VNDTLKNALLFGIFIATIALILGFLDLGFYIIYIPPILIAYFTVIFFINNINIIRKKSDFIVSNVFINNINIIRKKSDFIVSNVLFGFLVAWSTLFFSAISGSLSLLFIAYLEFLYPTVFQFDLTTFEAYSDNFDQFFYHDGIKYFLLPLIWGLLLGFVPALLFGLFYGMREND